MKHYQESTLLKMVNAIIEYTIIIISSIVAGMIREWIAPFMKKPFGFYDLRHYFSLFLVMGIVIIVIYYVLGDYRTIHYRNIRTLIIRVGIVHAIAIVLGFAILFGVNGTQLSRLLLLIFYGVSSLLMLLKRIVCHVVANAYVERHQNAYRVLIIGNGQLAIRYQKELCSDKMKRYKYIGYVAEKENNKLINYLGTDDRLPEILQENQIEQVVIAQDTTDRKRINKILSSCSILGIGVKIVPVFADFLLSVRPEIGEDGLISFDIHANKISDILGVHIAVTNIDKAMEKICENLENWRGKYICVSNVHTTVMAYEDLKYRKVQNGAVMALPDGGPLSAYSRARGSGEAKRVTGPDLMQEVLKQSGEHGWKHFFYGSKQETLDKLKEVLAERYPGAKIVGMISPPFRALSVEEEQAYVNQINEANPDFVWVGLGAPKQEIWMAAHENRVKGLMIGVGAAFDYESGNIKRAPKWMQKCSLEWLYRLMQDPKRLLKRYFVTNLKYMWLTRR